ncbi:MAG: T9SS type A sorting domain-containing protein [Saprospiraceae bacterium]
MQKTITLLLFSIFISTSSYSQCWEEINLNVDQQIIPNGDNYNIFFFNDSVGLIFSEFYVFKTNDGGQSWKVTFDESVVTANYQFFNDSVGLYATQRELYKTTDAGDNWTKISNYLENEPIPPVVKDIYFLDSLSGFAVGNEKMLIKTVDGGYTWEKIFSYNQQLYQSCDIDFIDSIYGFAGCSNNIFYKTSNGGETWEVVRNRRTDPGIANFEMIDTLNGIGIIGGIGQRLGLTTNGWNSYSLDTSVYFPINLVKYSTSRYWMASILGIYKSENFGRSWQSTLIGKTVRDIHFSSPTNGWAVGHDYLLLKYNPEEPECVNTLEFPQNASTNNPIQPTIKWSAVTSGCLEGYYISLGTTPDSSDILYRHFVGLDTSFSPGFALPYDTEIYLKIEPFNTLHFASGCVDFYFRTEVCPEPVQTFIDTTLTKNQVFLGQIWEQDTSFQVSLKAINNCDSIIQYNIVVDRSSTLETNIASQINLYPNPTSNFLHFQFSDHLKLNQIEVFSLNGKLQFKLEEIQSCEINLQNLPAGMYTIRFVFEDGVVSKKILKKP